MTKHLLGLATLVVAGSVTLAGCGSSSQTSSTGGTTPAAMATTASTGGETTGAMAAKTDLAVKTLDTFVFEPNTWEAPAGSEVTIAIDNSAGTQEHSWVLVNKGITRDEGVALTEADTGKIVFSKNVPAGQSDSGTFTAPTEPGDYVVVCHIPGHAAGGMVGTFTVK